MRAVRVVVRAFVYGTEDEGRVRGALLGVLGETDVPEAMGRLTRTRVRSHYGTEILLYEAVLRSPKHLRRFFQRLRSSPRIVGTLRQEFDRRLDEDRVLHFRLDKQAAVAGEAALVTGGDAISVAVKFESRGEASTLDFPFGPDPSNA